jgi:two-component system cell cycle response regulator DivK
VRRRTAPVARWAGADCPGRYDRWVGTTHAKKKSATVQPLVLVVDDYEDTLFLYSEYLSFAGFRTSTAVNGAEAIAKARAEHPDVIAMDLSMPDMDGWEATRLLKADSSTRGICIIALTGHAEPAFVESAKHAGCDHFLAKPCLPEELMREVLACLDEQQKGSLQSSR